MSKFIVCSNFGGRYNKTYIGHEFINLFPSDSCGWNFYVPSYGCVKKEFGKGNEPDYLVMVEPINGFYRLIGIAIRLEYVSDCYSSSDRVAIENENTAHGSICYFGKPLSFWFGSQPSTLFISYKLKKDGHIFVPSDKSDIFLSLVNEKTYSNPSNDVILIHGSWACYGNDRVKLIGQSQRSYYDDKKPSNGQILSMTNQIKELLAKGLLHDVSSEKPMPISTLKAMYLPCFIEMIGQENNENAFSNWLAEYLSDIDFFNHFAKKLGLKSTSKTLNVIREKNVGDQKRIDIYIETDEEMILIENKILSCIHKCNVNGTSISQLDIYEDSIKKEVCNSKTIKAFLLCPDYYEKYGYAGPSKLWNKSVWIPLCYSNLKDIVDTYMVTSVHLKNKGTKYIYMDEFSKALELHSKTKPESMRDVILRKIARK